MSLKALGLVVPILQFQDASGVPYASGTLTFYAAGTSNLQAVYSDDALTVSLTNPVSLNAAGRTSTSTTGPDTPVYLQALPYDVTLKDSTGSVIYGPITAAGSAWPGSIQGNVTIAPAANANGYANEINATIAKATSGTHALFAGLYLDAPSITAGAAALTESATLYVADAPATGTTKRAIHAPSGTCEFATVIVVTITVTTVSATTLNVSGVSALGTDVYTTTWTDYSATSTITGWSSFTSKVLFYKSIGKLVYVIFRIAGTSNAASAMFTLPITSAPTILIKSSLGYGGDNGSALAVPGLITMNFSDTTVAVYPNQANSPTWTSSGTKEISGQFWYEAT